MPHYKSILISGRPVSGKSTLASALAKLYGWKVFSVGKLWREEWEKKHPNRGITFEEYWRGTSEEANTEMDKRAKAIIEGGNVIGDLRFSELTKDPEVLKVFIDAGIKTRAERAKNKKEYHDLTYKQIKETLNKREKDELRMGRSIYGRNYDYRNPLHYHLVLNSGMLKLEEEVKAVAELMK